MQNQQTQNRKRLLLLTLLSLLLTPVAAEPIDTLLNYVRHAMLFNETFPQEKVYLHFDNTGYFKGEHIWFKAYVVRADKRTATGMSKVLYVDLLNPSGDVIKRNKLKIENGVAHGDILLDDLLGTGFYEVRAYTRYMMNWGGQTAFSRVFPVFKKPSSEGNYSRPTIDPVGIHQRLPGREFDADEGTLTSTRRGGEDKKLRVNFYPEGGDLVAGQLCRVAFEVMDGEGRHVAASGLLENQRGETLAIIQADASGRGLFDYIPDSQPSQLIMTAGNGSRHKFLLPQAKAEGCVVRLDVEEAEAVQAHLAASPALQGRLLGYTVMNGGHITHIDTLTLAADQDIVWRRSSFQPGVNQLTFFTSDGQVQAERLFFVYPTSSCSDAITVGNRTNALSSCSAVSLDLFTRPNASLSFSAMDAGTMTNGKEGTILSYMLLSSDLKGYIDSPDYYFEADDEEHRLAADTLMLINGWRRYDWKVMTDVEPWPGERQTIEDDLYIYGHLRPAQGVFMRKNPIGGVDMTMTLFNGYGQHLSGHTVTDSTGFYAFRLPDISEDWNMQIRTRIEDKLKSYSVCIDRHFQPQPRFIYPEETSITPRNVANLFRRDDTDMDEAQDSDGGAIISQIDHREFVIKPVKVKKRRNYWTDYDGGWYNEKDGRRLASLYYDCGYAAEELADKGEKIPTLNAWLAQHNSLFKDDTGFQIPFSGGVIFAADQQTADWLGPSYDGRPIIWSINNCFGYGTSFIKSPMDTTIHKPSNHANPVFLDEVKSVYIVSSDPGVMIPYITSASLEGENPCVIFVYTYPSYSTESNKGLRKTHFQGYNVPSTFEMEDYSILPPMEDFRRTLYWAPDVKTDATGRAHVDFFNNSSAREIFLSIEGMTPDGVFLSNE